MTNKSNIFSVAQINSYIKKMFDTEYALKNIIIKGEVSNITYHGSGHIYFKIKDEQSEIPAVMFAGSRGGLSFKMKDGDSCLVTCSITVYERGGRYQAIATKIENAGIGDLFKQFNELKDKLEEMGMFDDSYKKMIPQYATAIGVVTAKTGAAIRDIVQISTRRNPHVQIYLYPSLVQGEGAAESIARGIEYLDNMNLDVLIVGRGGGSIEDLWAFNEETVARAIFNCETPVISAVGHEIDYTIADYVADLRAPTPSAAAEIAVFDYDRLMADIQSLHEDLYGRINQRLLFERGRRENYYHKLAAKSPTSILNQQKMHCAELDRRLADALKRKHTNTRSTFSILSSKLDGRSPLKKFASGYAYPIDSDGNNIKSIQDISVNDEMTLYVSDGCIKSKVTDLSESPVARFE